MTFLSDMYMEAKLMQCAVWCIQHFSEVQHICIGLHNAAMLLFSTATAMHGGSSHILCWSDMFVSYIPMDNVHLGEKVPVSHENKMGP